MFSNPIFFCLLLIALRRDLYSAGVLGATCVLKLFLDMSAAAFLGVGKTWYHYLLVPFKDVLIAAIWFVPLVGKTVNWRGNQFIVGKHTSLAPVAQSGAPNTILSGALNKEWQGDESEDDSSKTRDLLRIVRMAARLSVYGTKRLFGRSSR
jgi:hypothetical protein